MGFFGDFFERFFWDFLDCFWFFFVFLCMDCLLCNSSARFHKIEKPKFNTTPCLGLADIIIDVSVDPCFPYFLARFLMRFSSKIDEKTGNYCTAAPFFFWLGDPYDSMYFTIRKPLSVFLLLSGFSQKMLQISIQNESTKKH